MYTRDEGGTIYRRFHVLLECVRCGVLYAEVFYVQASTGENTAPGLTPEKGAGEGEGGGGRSHGGGGLWSGDPCGDCEVWAFALCACAVACVAKVLFLIPYPLCPVPCTLHPKPLNSESYILHSNAPHSSTNTPLAVNPVIP
jgi:hypothetical protein